MFETKNKINETKTVQIGFLFCFVWRTCRNLAEWRTFFFLLKNGTLSISVYFGPIGDYKRLQGTGLFSVHSQKLELQNKSNRQLGVSVFLFLSHLSPLVLCVFDLSSRITVQRANRSETKIFFFFLLFFSKTNWRKM